MSLTVLAPPASTISDSPRHFPQTHVASVGEDAIVAVLPVVSALVAETCRRVPAHVEADDLRSAAMVALMLAARSFDPAHGVPFDRFAAIRIRGALLDALRDMDWASRSVRLRARELDAVRTELSGTSGARPTTDQLATALGVAAADIAAIDRDVYRATVVSSDSFEPDTGPAAIPDGAPTPEQLLVGRERIGQLHHAIATLPERLRFVIVAFYFERRLLSDIATDIGVTESRASQMRAEGVAMLRAALTAEFADDGAAVRLEPSARTVRFVEAVRGACSLTQLLNRTTSFGEPKPLLAEPFPPDRRVGELAA